MKRGWFGLALVGILMLGCGLLTRVQQGINVYATQLPQTLQAQKPTLEAVFTQAPTALAPVAGTPTPTAPAAPSGEKPVFAGLGSDIQEIRTFVESFTYTRTIGDKTFTLMEWEHRADREHQAEYFRYMAPELQEPVEVVFQQDTAWIHTGGQWIMYTINRKEVTPLSLGYYTPENLDNLEWTFVGEEQVNGQPTRHYRWSAPHVAAFPPSVTQSEEQLRQHVPGMPSVTEKTFQGMEAHIWVNPQGYVVSGNLRWNIRYTLAGGNAVDGFEELRYQLLYVNQPVEIPSPQPSETPQAPIPLPADAQLQLAQGNQAWIYTVPSWTVQQAARYFTEELPKQGYTVVQQHVSENSAAFILTTPQGQTFNIAVTLSATGQGVDVVIQAGP